MNAEDPARTGRAVFRKFRPASWLVSGVVHAGLFGAIAWPLLHGARTQTRVVEVSEMEFAPPPPPAHPPTPPPPPPPPPPTPEPEPAVHTRAVVAPDRPTSAPRSARSVEAPHVMTAAAAPNANSTNSMATGNSNDFHGGNVGGEGGGEPGGHPAPPTPPIAPHEHAPPPPPPPSEVSEDQLSVRPVLSCDESRFAAFYPEAAQDAEISGRVRLEIQIDAQGQVHHPHALNDPGFGLAAAAERYVATACRCTTIPRDALGRAVATRMTKNVTFTLE